MGDSLLPGFVVALFTALRPVRGGAAALVTSLLVDKANQTSNPSDDNDRRYQPIQQSPHPASASARGGLWKQKVAHVA